MSKVNRYFKDLLFCDLFGSEERKGYALELYNALTGSSCNNVNAIEFTTIGNIIYLGRKNDVSFLVDSVMVLLEHQSTYNPNMPELHPSSWTG